MYFHLNDLRNTSCCVSLLFLTFSEERVFGGFEVKFIMLVKFLSFKFFHINFCLKLWTEDMFVNLEGKIGEAHWLLLNTDVLFFEHPFGVVHCISLPSDNEIKISKVFCRLTSFYMIFKWNTCLCKSCNSTWREGHQRCTGIKGN